jgi:hypothetical protein
VQTSYLALRGNLDSFDEKKDELVSDKDELFEKDPAFYMRHVQEIQRIQARMATRMANLRKDSPEAAEKVEARVDEAQGFDPVAVRGLPDGWEFGSNGAPVRGTPDGPVEGPEFPELPEMPFGDV